MKFKKIFIGLFTISAIVCLASCKTGNKDNPGGDQPAEVIEYAVDFHSMGGSSVASQKIHRGSKVQEPVAPTREGYIFKGWYKDSSCTYPWDFDEDVVTGHVNLYAKWEPVSVPPIENKYSISFEMHEHGSAPQGLTDQTALPNPLPPVEDVEGWHFLGWYLDAEYNTPAEAGATINSATTLHAKWEEVSVPPVVNKYNISFEMHEHGSAPEELTNQTALPNPLPPVEDVEGWHFLGWYLDAEYNTPAEAGATINSATTLHAKWEEVSVPPVVNKYNISFEMHEHGSAPQGLTDQTALPNPLPPVEDVEGWHFLGWYLDAEYNTPAEAGAAITSATTLHAKWEEVSVPPVVNKYNISFEMHEHGSAPQGLTDQTALPNPLPSVEDVDGWHFLGWYLDAEYNTPAEAGAAITSATTLHAKWEEVSVPPVVNKYNISFEMHEHGSAPEELTNQTALPNPLPSVEDVDGWHFLGWYLDAEYNTPAEAGATINSATTLHAKWELKEEPEDSFEISYESEYGILPPPYKGVKLEDNLPVLTDDTYAFEGWYLTSDFDEAKKAVAGSKITEDTVLYAKWRSKTWYDILTEESEFVVLNNNFNNLTGADKLPEYDNTWDGEAGLYEGTGKSGSSTVDPSPTTTFIRLGNGKAELVDSSDGASVNLMARFGKITSGIVEGYLEATLSSQGNSWTFFQLNGTNATKTSTSEIFGIRIDGGLLKFRRNGGSVETAETSITAANSKYDIYFMIDLEAGTITVTVNDKPFVTDLNLGFTSVAGFKLTSSDGGSKTMSVDNVAVRNISLSLDEYKTRVKQNATDYLAGLNVSDEVKASCQSILDGAKSSIDSKNTVAEVKEAYNKFVSDIAVQILSAQKSDMVAELNSYVDKSLYTYEKLNKKDLNDAITAGTTNINAAPSYNAALNALNAAKSVIDAIPTDAEQLEFYKKSAVAELKVFKDSADYVINATQFADKLNEGITAINNATTIELVDSALSTAKENLSKVKTDAEELVAKKVELVALLNEKADELIAELTEDKYIAQINEELGIGTAKINAAKSIAEAEKERTDSANRMDAIFAAAASSINEYKEFAIAELTSYADEASTGYEDANLLNNIDAALNNGITAINNAAALDLPEPDVKDAITVALNEAKAAIDECIDDFENGVTEEIMKQGQVEVSDFGGNSETMFMEWKSLSGATDYQILLKGGAYADYTLVDEKICYVQSITGGYRADLLGLEASVYNAKIVPVISGAPNENASTIVRTNVVAYDRSGYAHFNYTEGVGAYDDKGVLKDNAIVLYVTDANKNTVELTYGGKTVRGIGNILNSAGQSCGEAGHENECKRVSKGKTSYGTANTNAGILKDLALAGIPLVVRFVGCVSNTGLREQGTFNAQSKPLIDGITVYSAKGSTNCDYGAIPGDNGHMARIRSGKDITLEGIGSGATIDGWGFHFICDSASPELAKSFEVRNLIFINTPEDAIGMEGVQESGKITASVERCWVHHNEFYGPSISNPTESDKSEGDGSCDFKRGQYFTCSYNYFEGCHKTNLVGSSDDSLQYNLTYHHNYWKLCKARGPLARNANIHMYNNIFEGQTDYAMNTRANSYIYSEYNLFYMCKNPMRVDSGAIKSFNDSFSSCINSLNGTVVSNKSQVVSNSCKYGSIDYSKFDTTASQSYIPSGNYMLQESVTEAKKVIYAETGTQRPHRIDPNTVALEDISYLPSGVTPTIVDTYPTTLKPGKISKTVYAFTINRGASVTVDASVESVIVNLAGECFLTGNGTAVLEAGTYMVQCMNIQAGDAAKKQDPIFKDMTINSIEFEEYNSAEFDEKLISDYNAKAGAIPSIITYSETCYQSIRAAMTAYNALRDELKSQVSVPYANVDKAFKDYIDLGKEKVENLITAIGTVNASSGNKIVSARKAYTELKTKDSSVQISNYSTLVAAEEEFKEFALQSCIDMIDAIGSNITLASKEAIEQARAEYEALSEDQQQDVTNYDKLVEAERIYEQLEATDVINGLIEDADLSDFESLEKVIKAYDELEDKSNILDTAKLSQIRVQYTIMLIDQIGTVTTSSKETIDKADTMYAALSETEKQSVTNYSVLTEAKAAFQELASQGYNMVYDSLVDEKGFFTTSGTIEDLSSTVTYNGVTYTKGLSMQGSGPTISFTPTQNGTIVMLMGADNQFNIAGSSDRPKGVATGTAGVYIIEYNVTAGTQYSFTRRGGRGTIYSISFTPTTTE